MSMNASYLHVPTFGDLLVYLDGMRHPYRYSRTIHLRGNPTRVQWTERAAQALEGRDRPLVAEMQLYFSCFVKKRVVFADQGVLPAASVNEHLSVGFHPVQSQSCDPEEFARHFPVKRELESEGANKMFPSRLEIDYRRGEWLGQFHI